MYIYEHCCTHLQNATLKHFTGYIPEDIKDVILDVNKAVVNTPEDVVAVKSKYSHE